jgi:hypothetical protein
MPPTALVRSRRAQERVTWPVRARHRARLMAGLAMAISLVVVVGHVFHLPNLTDLSRSPVTG